MPNINVAAWGLLMALLACLRCKKKRHIFLLQTLHVRVAEARGLMARDFAGRSDPFVVLDLTGRLFALRLSGSNTAFIHIYTQKQTAYLVVLTTGGVDAALRFARCNEL